MVKVAPEAHRPLSSLSVSCNAIYPVPTDLNDTPKPYYELFPRAKHGQEDHDPNDQVTHTLRTHSRLKFIIVFVLCSIASGVYASALFTKGLLAAWNVPEALAEARSTKAIVEQELERMSSCALEQSIGSLAYAKSQLEVYKQMSLLTIQDNADELARRENQTATCATYLFNRLRGDKDGVMKLEASTGDESNQSECLSSQFDAMLADDNVASSASGQLFLQRARSALLERAIEEAQARSMTEFIQHSKDSEHSPETDSVSYISKSLNASMFLINDELSRLLRVSSANVVGQMPIAIKELLRQSNFTVLGNGNVDFVALAKGMEEVGERLANKGVQVVSLVSGIGSALMDFVRFVGDTFRDFTFLSKALIKWNQALTKELRNITEEGQERVNATLANVSTTLQQFQHELVVGLDRVDQERRKHTEAMLNRTMQAWRRSEQKLKAMLISMITKDHLQALDSPNNAMIISSDDSKRFKDVRDQLVNTTQKQSEQRMSTDREDDESFDVVLMEGSLSDMGANFFTVILILDVIRKSVVLIDFILAILTHSYSDIPPVDIRDLSFAHSFTDALSLVRCHRRILNGWASLTSSLSNLLELIAQEIVRVLVGIGGTLLLWGWKNRFLDACIQSNGGTEQPAASSTRQTLFQLLYQLFSANDGEGSRFSRLESEMEQQTTLLNTEYKANKEKMRKEMESALRRQNDTFAELQDIQGVLTRIAASVQNCSVDASPEFISGEESSSLLCLNTGLQGWSVETPTVLDEPIKSRLPDILPNPPNECTGNSNDVQMLQARGGCAAERVVYLSVVTWWLLIIVFVIHGLVFRLIIRVAGAMSWRSLSGGRLQLSAFCYDDGNVHAKGLLKQVIERHLQDIRRSIRLKVVWIVCLVMLELVLASSTLASVS